MFADPLWVRYRGTAQAVTTLQKGRFVYVAYTQTTDAGDLSERIRGWRGSRAVPTSVVYIRQNGGGDNTRYLPLLDALKSKVVNRRLPTGAADRPNDVLRRGQLRRRRRAIRPAPGCRGAARGLARASGATSSSVALPHVGLEVLVATQYVERGRDGDTRAALAPAVLVELSSSDWFAGRDPALAAALR